MSMRGLCWGECDFSNPIVQESRGIIIDVERLEVVCWPFRKFGNFNESYADSIDWNTARVQDKIDGSIVKLWKNKESGDWEWSTNGMINAGEVLNSGGFSFMAMIRDAVNFSDIDTGSLNPENTYIFEMVHPYNQIVVKYDIPKLYHIGTRNNVTGQESNEALGIEKPAEYPIRSLKECIEAAKNLNAAGSPVAKEGFVVVDGGWNRVKVKSPEYLIYHHLVSSGKLGKKQAVELLMDADFNVGNFCREYPNHAVVIKYYDYKLAELFAMSREMAAYAKNLYEEFSHERKAVALQIQGNRLSSVGFWALSHPDRPIEEYWNVGKVLSAIPDYQPTSAIMQSTSAKQ